MSEVDSKDFVCEYSREKYEMEFLLQSYKMSKETVTLKRCLTVCIQTVGGI